MALKFVRRMRDKRAKAEKAIDPKIEKLKKYVVCSRYGYVESIK